MGYMTNMPDLTKEIPALVMDCLHHRLPSFNLLPGPDARSTGIAIATLRDCCGPQTGDHQVSSAVHSRLQHGAVPVRCISDILSRVPKQSYQMAKIRAKLE